MPLSSPHGLALHAAPLLSVLFPPALSVALTTITLQRRPSTALVQNLVKFQLTSLNRLAWTACKSSVCWGAKTFSTLTRWTRAALAPLPTPSRFSLWSVCQLYFTLFHPLTRCIIIFSFCVQDTERMVGCTGSPADSHDILWFRLTTEKPSRCPECGSGTYSTFVLLSFVWRVPTDVLHSVCHRVCVGRAGRVGSCPARFRTRARTLIKSEKTSLEMARVVKH